MRDLDWFGKPEGFQRSSGGYGVLSVESFQSLLTLAADEKMGDVVLRSDCLVVAKLGTVRRALTSERVSYANVMDIMHSIYAQSPELLEAGTDLDLDNHPIVCRGRTYRFLVSTFMEWKKGASKSEKRLEVVIRHRPQSKPAFAFA